MYQIAKSEEAISAYNKKDERGNYRVLELRNRNPVFNRENRPNLYYPIWVNPASGEVSLSHDVKHTMKALPINKKNEDGCWTWGREKVSQNLNLLTGKKVASGVWRIYRKDYLPDDGVATTKEKALWLDKTINHENGKEMLGQLFGKTPFDFPKSVELIKKAIRIGTQTDDIVLDFFAGSATTAHAVMALNAEDGGTRRCISIQIPETCDAKSEAAKAGYKTIADIGKERIRRAAQKIRAQIDAAEKEESGQKKIEREESERKESAAPLDLGFRVFQLACSNFREWSGAAKGTLESWKEAQQAALDLLPDKFDEESVVAEIMLAEGWTLTCRMEKLKSGKNRVWRITDSDFADGEKTMHICLDDKIAPDLHRRLGLTEDSVLVVRDKALTDCLAANLALQCRLKTV